jgi:hypothetical protein
MQKLMIEKYAMNKDKIFYQLIRKQIKLISSEINRSWLLACASRECRTRRMKKNKKIKNGKTESHTVP